MMGRCEVGMKGMEGEVKEGQVFLRAGWLL
jgi:hypothetical protein